MPPRRNHPASPDSPPHLRALMASPAYRAAIPDRQQAFREIRTFISDV